MRSRMCLLFLLLVLLCASHGMTQSTASTASKSTASTASKSTASTTSKSTASTASTAFSSGGLRCTQRNGTSLTVLMDAYMAYRSYTDYLQTVVDTLSERFPCVTRQYTSVILDFAETNETITSNKSDFIRSLSRNYWDDSMYYNYYNHILNCNQTLLYGLKRSLEISPAESIIVVYTLGSMVDYNDTQLLSEVYTLLKKKNSQVFFILYQGGYCPVSASQQDVFNKISSLSYGELINIANLDNIGMIHSFVLLFSKPLNSSVRILNINSNVTNNYTAGFNVPSFLTHLLITGNQLFTLNFTDPNGKTITYEKNPYFYDYNLYNYYYYSNYYYYPIILSSHLVKSPASGSWILNAQGNTTLTVQILGFTGSCLDSGCHPNATCSEFGGYGECTCKPGFAGDGKSCDDINECQSYYTNNCYHYSYGYCVNTIGSYTCNCISGYQYRKEFGCVDIDECADKSLSGCHPVALCTNDHGSYRCACPYGYYGDGRHCEVNECLRGSPCGSSSTIDCMKYIGSFSCVDPCSNHTVLNDPWRSTSNVYNYSNGYDWYHCDSALYGWYRFKGEYDQQIPEHCVQPQSCGTYIPIWMNGSHPTVSDGIVNRTVCSNWYDGCCTQPYNISVRMCPDGFYVYKLQSTQSCSYAYCTESNNRCSGMDCAPDEECRILNGVHGCYCKNSSNSTYGIRPGYLADFIKPQVTCGLENIEVRFSKCLLEQLGYNTSFIHLRDNSCRGVIERSDKSYLTLITRPTRGSCGGDVRNNGSDITYTNTVYLTSKSNGVIIRDEYPIDFRCSYPSDMEINLLTAISPHVVSANISVYGTSNFTVTMGLFRDSSFTNLYTSSAVLLDSSSTLYVGVIVTGATRSSQFVVVMKNCYATPTSNSNSIRYDIITNQCPNRNDPTISVAENGVSLRGRFSLQVFKFLGGFSEVYLHCQVGLCDTSSSDCSARCPSMRSALDDIGKVQDLTLGPIKQKGPISSDGGTTVPTAKLFISAIVFLLLLF